MACVFQHIWVGGWAQHLTLALTTESSAPRCPECHQTFVFPCQGHKLPYSTHFFWQLVFHDLRWFHSYCGEGEQVSSGWVYPVSVSHKPQLAVSGVYKATSDIYSLVNLIIFSACYEISSAKWILYFSLKFTAHYVGYF